MTYRKFKYSELIGGWCWRTTDGLPEYRITARCDSADVHTIEVKNEDGHWHYVGETQALTDAMRRIDSLTDQA